MLEAHMQVPQQMTGTAQAEDRVRGFTCLKNELATDMRNLNEGLQGLRSKILNNLKSDDHPERLLTRTQQEYLNTLKVNFEEQLGELLEQDNVHWTSNLEVAREDAARIEAEMREIIERSQIEMQALM